MTKISSKLKFDSSIRTKSFELGGYTFKVKVPLTKELEQITERIINVPNEDIEARLKKMTESLSNSNIDGVEMKDGDIYVDGRSTKDTVVAVLQMERKITEFFKLIVADNGSLEDITYEDIEAEFPMQTQFEFLEKINEVIQPGYKDARKN